MKEIKLKKLVLSNWRGQSREVNFGDAKTTLSGVNGCGKTTVMSSWLWLISGMSEPHNPKNFNLYDNREELSENTPWASVTAKVEIDGLEYEIQRKAKPKYTRSKGSMEFTKSAADSYEYYVDSIEVGATGFNNFIENTLGIPTDMLTYCLSGDFFSYLVSDDKNKARKVLCEIAGEVKPEDFKGDYSAIKELLERHTASEIGEMSKKKKKPLEERQNIIPLEIDRKEERLSELRTMDFTYTESEIERVKKEIETIDGLLLGNADALKPILEHNREIENKVANKRLSLVNGRLDHKEAQSARTSEIKAKIANAKRRNADVDNTNERIKKEFRDAQADIELITLEIASLKSLIESLRTKKNEIKVRVFTEDHCPYCGAELDPLEIEKKKEEFNNAKRIELEAIVAEGKAIKEKIEKKELELAFAKANVDKGLNLYSKEDLTPYEEELAKIEASFAPYEETDEFKRINAEIEALLPEMKEIPSFDNEALTSKKKGLVEELSELSKKLGLKDEIGKVEKEVAELREELRSVACSIAELEKSIYVAKAYEQEKHEIVSDRINLHLDHAKIQMFSTQKNGDIVGDCILLNKKGVRMSSTNFADRILISLSLQMLFMEKMGVRLPIWVDESAVFSSNNLPSKEGYQMIYMLPSDSPYLVVE